jgi:biopolymer transport protein ExbB/TolQ/uncharacterized protein YxeA
MIYNFVFLGVMVIIYLVGMIGGMFKMNNLSEAMLHATDELTSIFKGAGKVATEKLRYLNGIFSQKYLDQKMENFTDSVEQSQEGIVDIEEYLNEEELDLHIHKRLLEMIPDILTSLGILGTFVGLVWGLKDFEPTNYEAMTTSVASLVDGIKVAFLTSIYGIALSIIYTYGMKREYSYLTECLQAFLEKFHSSVLPTAENESRNLLVSSQNNQTAAMQQMAEQFSTQMADSFEKVITPTFQKMNDSLDTLVNSVTQCQTDAIHEILNAFLKEMNLSFRMEFRDFGNALEDLNKAQKQNVEFTTNLYKNMSQQLSESYAKQERLMREQLEDMGTAQNRFLAESGTIAQSNKEIQRKQQEDYQHLTDYLKEAEKSSAKFWVACNQTMQKYVEAAAQGMERISGVNQVSTELMQSNKRVIETFDVQLKEFMEYQKLSAQTMEQVRALLSEISVAKDTQDVYLTGGGASGNAIGKKELEKLQGMLESQNERQQELLEDMAKNIRELSKSAQKGKFSLFK